MDPAAAAPRPTDLRHHRRERARRAARDQHGVLSRPQLYAAGWSRAELRAELRAARWQRLGPQTVAVFTGPLTRAAVHWAAVLEGGPRAFLDGVSALVAAGLEHVEEPDVRVSVPRGARVRRVRGIDVRQTRRWERDDVVPVGIPRARPEVAAVRAALWARSDKQAALYLTMTVQQGLTTADRLGRQALRVRRDRRRELVHAVVLDLVEGARTLSEAEFARACSARGLPTPDLNRVRETRAGRRVHDAEWTQWGVVVEMDGVQHSWAQEVVPDALRQNEAVIDGATVLRLPLLGFRVAADEFFEQVERALVARGWRRRSESGAEPA